MNMIRCLHCGAALSVTDEPGGERVRCASCGQVVAVQQSADTADSSATAIFRPGHAATQDPGAAPSAGDSPSDQADTDPGAAATHTIVYKDDTPGESATGSPGKGPASELYDFLAPPQNPDELGRLGPYRVLKVLGAGGMGVVFEAEDAALERRVALKAMLPTLAASTSARQRFLREARAAAAIENERIVQIYHVGEDRGVPFLVMPLLRGESLENRINPDRRLPMNEVLRIGREIAEALSAAHDRGLIHRDIKPANVWLEGPGAHVKLLDFGLARAAETDAPLTQQGSIVGTPAFMAPEQATGGALDGRCDLFSLGCVLYRMCTGRLPFEGTSGVSILMAIVGKEPATPLDVFAGVPEPLSRLIMLLLSKKPAERPASAHAVIEALNTIQPIPREIDTLVAVTPGRVTERICSTQIIQPSPTQTGSAGALPAAVSPAKRGRSWILVLAAAGLAIVLGTGAWMISPLLYRSDDQGNLQPAANPSFVEIGIAYGTEKQAWFNQAVAGFAATQEGKNIKINLIPMGSLEGGKAVATREDQRIHVWSPASSLYKDTFLRDWRIKHPGHNPIVKEEPLALTPIVFVMWKERHDAFIGKYKTISFPTIAKAMHEKAGWGDIAGRPEWGRFRFGHTNPQESNSGLMTLVLLAYNLNDKDKGLTHADITRPEFQAELTNIERGLAGMSNSTGNLMKDMVSRGPSAYDALIVYESVAIDYLRLARGRWGDLRVAYPTRNLWSENPYYILDVPWSSKDQSKAADAFLSFLMSEPAQRQALAHGFRPANINIPILGHPDSPFVVYRDSGLSVNLPAVCDPPGKPIIDDLLQVWERSK
jgi:serine/threonine protein kinase